MEKEFIFYNPLMNITKSETWRLAYEIGGKDFIEIIKYYTHTCYKGNRTNLNNWGYGCGICPACLLREKGWNEYRKKYDL